MKPLHKCRVTSTQFALSRQIVEYLAGQRDAVYLEFLRLVGHTKYLFLRVAPGPGRSALLFQRQYEQYVARTPIARALGKVGVFAAEGFEETGEKMIMVKFTRKVQ